MKTFSPKFVLDVTILIDFLLKREGHEEISKIIEYLVKNKKGFISSSSLPTLYYVIWKYKKEIFGDLPKVLKRFIVWKTPAYIDWNHPLAQEDIEDYLIHLTAESLDAYVITRDKKFLKLSDRAITIEKFFEIVQKEKEEKRIPFLNLPSQVSKIYPDIEKKWDDILANAGFVCGKYVKKFEEKFSEYLGAKFCIGVNSGTSALIVALIAIGLSSGDEVIMPVNSFVATAEAVSILGGKPVFVDIHPDYYTIDVTQIEKKITKKTKAIIPVHLYGQCADMDPIMEVAKKYNLWVIEDACQAHGAEYKGKKAGTIGHIGCFSFYPGKNLGSWGEAGACVTNDEELAVRMYKIRNHGGTKKYQHEVLGGNFRMEELQGAVLIEKLKYLDTWNKKRREVAKEYKKHLKFLEEKSYLVLPKEAPYNKHIFHLFVVQAERRDELLKFLNGNFIETKIHYPRLLTDLTTFKENRYYKNKEFKNAKRIKEKLLSLPINESIKVEDITYITKVLEQFYEKND